MATFIRRSAGATLGPKLDTPNGPDGIRADLHDTYPIRNALVASDQGLFIQSLTEPMFSVLALVGPVFKVRATGDRIIVEGETSSPGRLVLETRSASGVWSDADSEHLLAGVFVRGVAVAAAGDTEFRLRLECPSGYPSRAQFLAQVRP